MSAIRNLGKPGWPQLTDFALPEIDSGPCILCLPHRQRPVHQPPGPLSWACWHIAGLLEVRVLRWKGTERRDRDAARLEERPERVFCVSHQPPYVCSLSSDRSEPHGDPRTRPAPDPARGRGTPALPHSLLNQLKCPEIPPLPRPSAKQSGT